MFPFMQGVMIERSQYEVLVRVQSLRDSLLSATTDRVGLLEVQHQLDSTEVAVLQHHLTDRDRLISHLTRQLNLTQKKGKGWTGLGVVVGAVVTFLIVRK